jgi:hypothetical protein
LLLPLFGNNEIAFCSNSFNFLPNFDAALGSRLAVAVLNCKSEMTLSEKEQLLIGSGIDIKLV